MWREKQLKVELYNEQISLLCNIEGARSVPFLLSLSVRACVRACVSDHWLRGFCQSVRPSVRRSEGVKDERGVLRLWVLGLTDRSLPVITPALSLLNPHCYQSQIEPRVHFPFYHDNGPASG